MYDGLHIPTALFVGGLTSALAGGIMLGQRPDDPFARRAIRYFACAALLFSLAMFGMVAASARSSSALQWCATVLGVSAIGVAGEGARAMMSARTRPGLIALVLMLVGAMLWLVRDSGRLIPAAQIVVTLISLDLALTLWRGRRTLAGPGVTLMSLLAAGVGLISLIRALDLLGQAAPQDPGRVHQMGSVGQIITLVYVLTPMVLLFTVTLILHRRSQLALEALANKDPLTGLANRRVLMESGSRLNQRRRDDPAQVAVMMIDIDHFKLINDRYGHRAGDGVLQQVAQTMGDALRGDALLARYGGEEFGALVPVADPSEARAVAERLREAVAGTQYLAEGEPITVTVSIGMSLSDRTGETFDELLRAADRRVYSAKARGRNRVVDVEGEPDPTWTTRA